MDSAEVKPAAKPVDSKAGKAVNSKVPTVVNWAKFKLDKTVQALISKSPETNCKVGALMVWALVTFLMAKSPYNCCNPVNSTEPKASPLMTMLPAAVSHAATWETCDEAVAVKSEKEQSLFISGVAVVKVESKEWC